MDTLHNVHSGTTTTLTVQRSLQVATLYAEFLPSSWRGQAILFLSFFWAAGACFEALLAWIVMPRLGWRYLLAFSTVPLLLFVAAAPKHLPESPIYLASRGKKEEAEELVKRVSIKAN